MVLSRAASLPQGLGRAVFRRAGPATRNRSWRQVGRRGYASGHGHGQQSSEIPWIIGSAAVTIPAAGWLWQQGPKGGSGHGHHESHEKHEESEEKEESTEEEPQEEESKEEESKDEEPKDEEPKEDAKDDEPKEESKEEDKDEGKDEDSSEQSEESGTSEDGYELPPKSAPQQINWNSSSSKGPGEQQKGQRAPTEKKGEKDSQGTFSGAKHPYLDDPEKSKKGLGTTETAKIHGTVDPFKGARGVKDSGSDGSS